MAIPLIADNGSAYTFCRDALDFIADHSRPINFCIIFGAPKTGKSTLAQSIFCDEDGVNVNAENFQFHQNVAEYDQDLHPVLWIWNKSLNITTESGEYCSMMILESGNGIGSWKDNSPLIFALSVLLSDHVIYTGAALLDEQTIAELRPIRSLTRFISTKPTPDQEEDGVDFGRFFPHLTWVIRDHPGLHTGDDDGDDGASDERLQAIARRLALAGREYLDGALRVAGFSDEVDERDGERAG